MAIPPTEPEAADALPPIAIASWARDEACVPIAMASREPVLLLLPMATWPEWLKVPPPLAKAPVPSAIDVAASAREYWPMAMDHAPVATALSPMAMPPNRACAPLPTALPYMQAEGSHKPFHAGAWEPVVPPSAAVRHPLALPSPIATFLPGSVPPSPGGLIASAANAPGASSTLASSAAAPRVPLRLPRRGESSEATTQACRTWFQTSR